MRLLIDPSQRPGGKGKKQLLGQGFARIASSHITVGFERHTVIGVAVCTNVASHRKGYHVDVHTASIWEASW